LFSNWRPKPVDAQCPHGERQLVFTSVQIGIFVVPWGVDQRYVWSRWLVWLTLWGKGMGSVGWWVRMSFGWVPISTLRFGPQRSFPMARTHYTVWTVECETHCPFFDPTSCPSTQSPL
jgi:hypothetical protein